MNEQEWLAFDEPSDMLKSLQGKMSDRKFRLFATACCRWIWELIDPDENGRFVELVEESSDQLLGEVGIGLADKPPFSGHVTCNHQLIGRLLQSNAGIAAYEVAFQAPRMVWGAPTGKWSRGEETIAKIARDVFGNPFRPITLAATHRTSTVVSLAREAYDERRLPSGKMNPQRLTLLAAALEEVRAPGELVAHLRGPGPHVRGCFAVDLCLGLE